MTIGNKIKATVILGGLLGALLTAGANAAQQPAAFDKELDKDGAAAFNYSYTTTLATPPLVPDGNAQLDCYIINVGKKPRFVTIDALTRTGVVVASWSGVINPETEEVAVAKATDQPRSCRFVVEGPAKDFRASGLVVAPGVGSISALAAQ
jgi:hypothetical protein